MSEPEYRGALERMAAQRAADEGQAPTEPRQGNTAARPWAEVFAEVAPAEAKDTPAPAAAVAKGWDAAIKKAYAAKG